uniref:Uncharacterized protein n=1 Tax=Nicotiana tabacum TaxID=4097 RepID=A0A1S4CIJ3_TOBAC|nr:PREDICTED: uncharacterized protein LOC107819428 [Nicotiana tabacum]
MRNIPSVQIARCYFALSASFHGTLGYAVGKLTTSLFVCLLSVISGRGVLGVATSLNVFKVAKLSAVGVVSFSATTAADELMDTRVIVFLRSSNLPWNFWFLLLLS